MDAGNLSIEISSIIPLSIVRKRRPKDVPLRTWKSGLEGKDCNQGVPNEPDFRVGDCR